MPTWRPSSTGHPPRAGEAVAALVRKTPEGYFLETTSPAGVVRVRYHTLVAALHADPGLRQLWRPVSTAEWSELGADVLFVVPTGPEG